VRFYFRPPAQLYPAVKFYASVIGRVPAVHFRSRGSPDPGIMGLLAQTSSTCRYWYRCPADTILPSRVASVCFVLSISAACPVSFRLIHTPAVPVRLCPSREHSFPLVEFCVLRLSPCFDTPVDGPRSFAPKQNSPPRGAGGSCARD
jgi:hypothetical protein